MTYFNYHAKIKRLICEGHLLRYELMEEYHGIKPALVLFFDNNRPMPVREHRWAEYFSLLSRLKS